MTDDDTPVVDVRPVIDLTEDPDSGDGVDLPPTVEQWEEERRQRSKKKRKIEGASVPSAKEKEDAEPLETGDEPTLETGDEPAAENGKEEEGKKDGAEGFSISGDDPCTANVPCE